MYPKKLILSLIPFGTCIHPDIPEYVPKPGDENAELTAGLAEKTAWALTTDEFPEAEEAKRRGLIEAVI